VLKDHLRIEELQAPIGRDAHAAIRAGFSRHGAQQYASKLYVKLRGHFETRLAAQQRNTAVQLLCRTREILEERKAKLLAC
jgi:hypothetical protein